MGEIVARLRRFGQLTEDQPAASRRASALADQYAQLPGWEAIVNSSLEAAGLQPMRSVTFGVKLTESIDKV